MKILIIIHTINEQIQFVYSVYSIDKWLLAVLVHPKSFSGTQFCSTHQTNIDSLDQPAQSECVNTQHQIQTPRH
jgi:hypothetical protein